MSTPSRELLIVSPARWDEACFSVPAVRALAGSGLGIGVLCQPHQQEFWQTLPGLEVRTPDTLETTWKVALLWEDSELCKVARKAGIQKRIGPACGPKAGGRSRKIGKLPKQLTETLNDEPHPTEHRVQFYLKAVEEMGVETAKPEYFRPVHERRIPAEPSVLLCADSDFGPSREWDFGHWLDLCTEMSELQAKLTVGALSNLPSSMGGPLHGGFPDGTVGDCDIDLQQPDLTKLAGFDVVIAADGSLPHLAAHMGATCITLFGPNDANWKRPLGRRHHVVRQPVECSPCFHSKCPLDLRCQKELDVDTVLKAIEEAIGVTSARS